MSVLVTQYPTQNAYYAKNTVPQFIISADERVSIIIKRWTGWDYENFDWTDADTFFEGSYVPDFLGNISIDFKDCYSPHMWSSIPDAGSTSKSQTKFWTYFRANIIDSQGTSTGIYSWFVCNALLNSSTPFENWARQNFLTNQPLEKPTTYDSPEWLTWFDTEGSHELVVRFYPKNGGSFDTTVKTDTVEGCFSENVCYSRMIRLANRLPSQLKGYYDLILFNDSNNELCRQRYIYSERSGKEHYFLFVNALGGIDTMICDGENVLQPETTHNVGRFDRQYKPLDDTDDPRKWLQQTGMVPYRWRNWIHELLTAKQDAAFYNQENSTLNNIVITESEIGMSDNGQLASASFSYIMSNVDNVMADTERAIERSLHASVAEQAEDLHDETSQVSLAFADNGNGEFETEEVTLAATKLYVEFEPTTQQTTIYYSIDGKRVGHFDPSEDTSPVIITKSAAESIQFSSKTDVLAAVIVSYYPVTIQAV